MATTTLQIKYVHLLKSFITELDIEVNMDVDNY